MLHCASEACCTNDVAIVIPSCSANVAKERRSPAALLFGPRVNNSARADRAQRATSAPSQSPSVEPRQPVVDTGGLRQLSRQLFTTKQNTARLVLQTVQPPREFIRLSQRLQQQTAVTGITQPAIRDGVVNTCSLQHVVGSPTKPESLSSQFFHNPHAHKALACAEHCGHDDGPSASPS